MPRMKKGGMTGGLTQGPARRPGGKSASGRGFRPPGGGGGRMSSPVQRRRATKSRIGSMTQLRPR
jgi:hypothetical protein